MRGAINRCSGDTPLDCSIWSAGQCNAWIGFIVLPSGLSFVSNLGEGAYGSVVQCLCYAEGPQSVAVKALKHSAGDNEASIQRP